MRLRCSMKRGWAQHRVRLSTIIEAAMQSGRTVLSEAESKQILTSYGIPVVETVVAENEEAARWRQPFAWAFQSH